MENSGLEPIYISSEELTKRTLLGTVINSSKEDSEIIEHYGNSWVDFILSRRGKRIPSVEERALLRANIFKLRARKSRRAFKADVLSHLISTTFYGGIVVFTTLFGRYWPMKTFAIVIYFLGFLLIPSFQRIHDAGKSAWWLLVPGLNIYLLSRPSTTPNKYGDSPYR